MKKVISMLLFVAAAAFANSCDDADESVDPNANLEDTLGDENEGDNESENEGDNESENENENGGESEDEAQILYTGTTSVSNGFTSEDVKYYVSESEGELTVEMIDAQFTQYMPVINIVISGIALSDDGSFEAESLTPVVTMEVGGTEVEVEDVSSYIITNTSGTYSAESFSINFSCMGCDISFASAQ